MENLNGTINGPVWSCHGALTIYNMEMCVLHAFEIYSFRDTRTVHGHGHEIELAICKSHTYSVTGMGWDDSDSIKVEEQCQRSTVTISIAQQ